MIIFKHSYYVSLLFIVGDAEFRNCFSLYSGTLFNVTNVKKTIQFHTPRQKSIRALEIFRVQKLILNATS